MPHGVQSDMWRTYRTDVTSKGSGILKK